jgi:hypothetical protein
MVSVSGNALSCILPLTEWEWENVLTGIEV